MRNATWRGGDGTRACRLGVDLKGLCYAPILWADGGQHRLLAVPADSAADGRGKRHSLTCCPRRADGAPRGARTAAGREGARRPGLHMKLAAMSALMVSASPRKRTQWPPAAHSPATPRWPPAKTMRAGAAPEGRGAQWHPGIVVTGLQASLCMRRCCGRAHLPVLSCTRLCSPLSVLGLAPPKGSLRHALPQHSYNAEGPARRCSAAGVRQHERSLCAAGCTPAGAPGRQSTADRAAGRVRPDSQHTWSNKGAPLTVDVAPWRPSPAQWAWLRPRGPSFCNSNDCQAGEV